MCFAKPSTAIFSFGMNKFPVEKCQHSILNYRFGDLKSQIYLEAIYWKLFMTGTLFTLCNIPITKEELSWKWLALPWFPFGKTPFCNAPWAMKTFQISSDDQWWVTCKAIWIPLQGEFNFRFRYFFFFSYWNPSTKNSRVVHVSCLWVFFLEINKLKELRRGRKTGEVQDISGRAAVFLIVCFLITVEAVSALKTEKQIMNKNSPVAESQLVPDLCTQTPLLSWISHCLQPVVESEYH